MANQWRWPVNYSNIVDLVILFPNELIFCTYQQTGADLFSIEDCGRRNYPSIAVIGIPYPALSITKVGLDANGYNYTSIYEGSLMFVGY